MGTNPKVENRWPCLGNPSLPGVPCAAEGVLTIYALVPMWRALDTENATEEPVVVLLTSCKEHSMSARKHLRGMTDEPLEIFGSEIFWESMAMQDFAEADLDVWQLRRGSMSVAV